MPRKTSTATSHDTALELRISIGAFRRRAQESIAEGELTEPQLRVLSRLERYGPATTAELARREQMTPQAMGGTTSALDKLGYISRVADKTDGRRVILHLTETGVAAVRSGRSEIVDRITDALDRSFTRAEVATLSAAAPLILRLSDLI